MARETMPTTEIASDRVVDVIQGHPGKTASEGRGDMTITGRRRVIDPPSDHEPSNPETDARTAA